MKRVFLLSLPLFAFVWAFSPAALFNVSGKIQVEQGNPALIRLVESIQLLPAKDSNNVDGEVPARKHK